MCSLVCVYKRFLGDCTCACVWMAVPVPAACADCHVHMYGHHARLCEESTMRLFSCSADPIAPHSVRADLYSISASKCRSTFRMTNALSGGSSRARLGSPLQSTSLISDEAHLCEKYRTPRILRESSNSYEVSLSRLDLMIGGKCQRRSPVLLSVTRQPRQLPFFYNIRYRFLDWNL